LKPTDKTKIGMKNFCCTSTPFPNHEWTLETAVRGGFWKSFLMTWSSPYFASIFTASLYGFVCLYCYELRLHSKQWLSLMMSSLEGRKSFRNLFTSSFTPFLFGIHRHETSFDGQPFSLKLICIRCRIPFLLHFHLVKRDSSDQSLLQQPFPDDCREKRKEGYDDALSPSDEVR
jgi:hypothetical protein